MTNPPARPQRPRSDVRPEIAFQWAPAAGQSNLPPWDGLQSFGTVDVTADALAVALRGIDGRERYRVELPHT